MNERDESAQSIAQLHELLSVTRRQLDSVGPAQSTEEQRHTTQELARLGNAAAQLSASLGAEDCAQAAEAFAECFADQDGGTEFNAAVLANCTDLLTYLQYRIEVMGQHRHVLGPTETDRLALARLVVTLLQTREQVLRTDAKDAISVALRTSESPVSESPEHAEVGSDLTKEERDLLTSFQTSAVLPGARHLAANAGQDVQVSPIVASLPHEVTAEELNHIPAEMKRFFVVETREDIENIQRMVLDFERHPGERSILSEMGRLAHKIKGAAATLGFDVLAAVALIFEDVIRAVQSATVNTLPDVIATLTGLLAYFEAALAAAAQPAPHATLANLKLQAEIARDSLLSRLAAEVPQSRNQPLSVSAVGLELPGSVASAAAAQTGTGESHTHSADIESLLRVEVGRLDKLMTHVNALVLNRASYMQMRDDILNLQSEHEQALERLRDVSQLVTERLPHDVRASLPNARRDYQEARPPGSHVANRTWDNLELERFTELDQALRQLTEVVADTAAAAKFMRSVLTRLDQIGDEQAAITHDIQRDVIQIRLVRLEDLMPRMQLEARRLATTLGKRIVFTVRGEMTEIDRNISEALAEPLIQLVRNAVVHGIESREERLDQGKPESGNVWIHAYYVGSEVVIEVGDDGRGVNPYRLAAAAVAMGLLSADSARDIPLSEALDMMFLPGITTFHEAQMVAGRGIGLDEVRTAIRRLKGTIAVRSDVGKGSVFRIRVPISLSIVRALSVQIAGQTFAVPFSSVLQMTSVAQSDLGPLSQTDVDQSDPTVIAGGAQRPRIRVRAAVTSTFDADKPLAETARDTGTDEIDYEDIPALRLADLLGFEASIPTNQLALIVEVGRRRAALLVDQVAADEEVVVQTLPPHLRRRSIRGATVTPDGVVQLLLDLPELLQGTFDGHESLPPVRRRMKATESTLGGAPRVLVVDDSMSIRSALELALSRAGFDVMLARDGIEAFELMLATLPKVMVLDIEMPRLDGFELLSVMRDTPQFAGVRVVMLTSRAAAKHQAQAMALGASAYLIKPCPQETLIETIRAQLQGETASPTNPD